MRTLAALAALLLVGACSATRSSAAGPVPTVELVVFAAASLTTTFTSLGSQFEAAHPGAKVTFSFDGSSALVDQLKAGAPADVFASADRPTMDKAASAGLIAGTPSVFATNVLTLIVPAGNPAKITGLDASLDGKKLVVCADGVPCGTATTKLAGLLGVTLKPVSEETKVTDVRTKVESGQADAGIVYVTDAKASGDKVLSIAISGADKVRNDYVIAATKDSKQAALAAAFVDLVTGPDGQKVLASAGFEG